jgi:hypothetical protein
MVLRAAGSGSEMEARDWCVGELGIISIINSRILSMTTAATTTCNLNILDVLNNKMNGNK